MIPQGAHALIAMRLNGKCPTAPIWVNVGDFTLHKWWRWAETVSLPEIVVRPEDPLSRLDFRCIVGLNVVLYCMKFGARAREVYALLQDHAAEIAILSPQFEEDIGFYWLHGRGEIALDDRHKYQNGGIS